MNQVVERVMGAEECWGLMAAEGDPHEILHTAGLITPLLHFNCYYIMMLLLPYQRRHMTSGISPRGHVTHPTPPPSSNCSFQCGNHGNSQLEPVCDT